MAGKKGRMRGWEEEGSSEKGKAKEGELLVKG